MAETSDGLQAQQGENHRWLLWVGGVLVAAVAVLAILYYVVKLRSIVNYVNKLFHKNEKQSAGTGAPAHPSHPKQKREGVDCAGAWGAWGACSSSCGWGTQERTYAVTTPKSGDGAACAERDGATQTRACSAVPCGLRCGDGNTSVSLSFFDLSGLPPQPTVSDLSACSSNHMYPLCSETTQQTGACINNSLSQKLTAGLPLVTLDNQTIDTVQSCTPACDGNDDI